MQKRVRVGGGLVSDPYTVEARDTYCVSLEKGTAGNSGSNPDVPISLSAALTLARSLDSGTKGLYGTKFYILPTTELQDIGTGVTLNKLNLSLEGVSVSSREGNGIISNPSMYSDDAAGAILTISSSIVEIIGLSLNAQAENVDMIRSSGTIAKPFITECRFICYGAAGAGNAAPLSGVRGIEFNSQVLLAEIKRNAFFRCQADAIYASDLRHALVSENKIFGPGFTGQTIVDGIDITGLNVAVDNNVVNGGYIGSANQGSGTGIKLSGDSCLSSNNVVAGFATAVTATLSRNDSTT